jgi:hypothetical protein
MVAIVETFRKISVTNAHKIITIQTSAAAATGHTVDFNSDATDGKGVVLTEILNTILQDDAGADVAGTFVPSTGIYTLGTVTTGIHNLTGIGY